MKATLIVGMALAILPLAGSGPANAVPLAPRMAFPDAQSLVVPARHYRHHRHWRHRHSRGWDDDPAVTVPPAVEGQTTPPPGYGDPGASISAPAAPRTGGSARRPSIRWVDPDRSAR